MRHWAVRTIKEFVRGAAAPVDLAVFRIAVCGMLLIYLYPMHKAHEAVEYSRLSDELLVPPVGLDRIVPHLPIDPRLTMAMLAVLTVALMLGLIGLWSRLATGTAAIVGVYVLGIPQFFGKVNHFNHLLWFLALVALSRSGDALAVDSIRAARKRADRGGTAPPAPSSTYGLPLRIAWLSIGLIYFFPGLWKFESAGLRWGLSDNVRNHIWSAWATYGDPPLLRIDRVEWLYKGAGLATLAFELGFIFCVLVPSTRKVVRWVGLAFHNFTRVSIHIPFWELQACYVVFFDWDGILRRVGSLWARGRPRLRVAFDGDDRDMRWVVAQLRAADVLHTVDFLDSRESDSGDELVAASRRYGLASQAGDDRAAGRTVLHAAAARIPLAVPLLPALRRRLDSGHRPRFRATRVPTTTPVAREWPVAAFGTVLLAAMVYTGAHNHVRAWPVSSYPDFRGFAPSQRNVVTFEVTDASGAERTLSMPEIFGGWTTPDRYESLIGETITVEDPDRKALRIAAVWSVARHHTAVARSAVAVEIHLDVFSTDPADRADPPVAEHVLYTFTVTSAAKGEPATIHADGRAIPIDPLPT